MGNLFEVVLPDVGDGVTEAFVAMWLKRLGDHVSENESIVEVMTDKANIDVPSPVAGILREQRFGEESRVEVGEVLAVIEIST